MPVVTPSEIHGQAPVAPAPKQENTIDSTQQQPQEAASEATQSTPEDKAQETLSPKFAALARQQKMLRQQQRQIEDARKAMEAERQEIEKAKSWKTRLTQDPYSVLLEAGLTSDKAAALMLQQPDPAAQQLHLLQEEIKALKASQEQSSTKFEQMQKQQYEDAKKQIRSDVTSLINSDETFETIKAMDSAEAVVDLIEKTFVDEGRLMTVEEAAKEIEDYLSAEVMKFTQLKKVKSKLIPPQPDPGIQKQDLTQKPSMTTLSNRAVQSQARPMTARERRERAILAFQGKLQ